MIAVKKKKEPEFLSELRKKASERGLDGRHAYKTLSGKKKILVRNSLVEEQGGLCVYCMCRIPCENVDKGIDPITIEHYIPEDCGDSNLCLSYENMLASCHGNRQSHGKQKRSGLTCDAHKGNNELRKINPLDPETLSSIYYTMDGKIRSEDPDVKEDLEITLNLNCSRSSLVEERKNALDSLLEILGNPSDNNYLNKCKSILSEFKAETNPKTPYVGILIWHLESMLRSLNMI